VRIRLRNHLLSSEFCNRCLAALDIGAGVEQPFALSKCFCFVRIRLRNHLLSSEFCNRCLAALDIGAGVEQPVDCLIVQNRQAVQSVGRSMDWTVEDNMVGCLFFCATLTGRRGGNTPFVQAGAESPTPVRRRLSRIQVLLERVIPRRWVPMSGMKVRSLVRLLNHSAFHW